MDNNIFSILNTNSYEIESNAALAGGFEFDYGSSIVLDKTDIPNTYDLSIYHGGLNVKNWPTNYYGGNDSTGTTAEQYSCGFARNPTVIMTNKPAFISLQSIPNSDSPDYSYYMIANLFEFNYSLYKDIDNDMILFDWSTSRAKLDIICAAASGTSSENTKLNSGNPSFLGMRKTIAPLIYQGSTQLIKFNPILNKTKDLYSILMIGENVTTKNTKLSTNINIMPADGITDDFNVIFGYTSVSRASVTNYIKTNNNNNIAIALSTILDPFYDESHGFEHLEKINQGLVLSFSKVLNTYFDNPLVSFIESFIRN